MNGRGIHFLVLKKCCHGAQPNPRLHLLIFSSTPLSGFGPNPPIHKAKGEFTERVQINLTGKIK
jgi:hypothetical protein